MSSPGSRCALRRVQDLNEVPFNAAMSACERSDEWQQALLMLSALNSYRLRLSTATCNTVISCLGNAGLWQDALGFLFQQRFRADRISLNAAISASEKAGEWCQAMKVFDRFGSLQLTPDILSYNGIISSFEKANQWQRALDILWTLPIGLRPTIITYNATISALEKAGKWQLALDLLKVLMDELLAPTHITYAAAISACEKSGEWERALILLKDIHICKNHLFFLSKVVFGFSSFLIGHIGYVSTLGTANRIVFQY